MASYNVSTKISATITLDGITMTAYEKIMEYVGEIIKSTSGEQSAVQAVSAESQTVRTVQRKSTPEQKRFFENFLRLCADRNEYPGDVAINIGLSRSAVTRWKEGSMPTNIVRQNLANYFVITIDELMNGSPKSVPDEDALPVAVVSPEGRAVRAARKERGLSVKELSELIGYSVSVILGWETDTMKMSSEAKKACERVFGNDIFTREA